MQRVIGIDFGTSTTYMNVKRYNGDKPVEDRFSYMPVMFNYGESSGFVSSVVRRNADGTFDFGEKATELLEGAQIYTEFKMRLESPDEAQRAEARQVTEAFFRFLYETYTQQEDSLGYPDDTVETIVSYPVKWQAETVNFMLNAARAAGFPEVTGMDEATAAVSTAMCRRLSEGNGIPMPQDRPGYLLLIDMGAGTTDLAVCQYLMRPGEGLHIDMVASWPRSAQDPTFGGREVDKALEGYVERYLRQALAPAFANMAPSIAALPGQAKLWKERNVSVNLAAGKPVTTCGYLASYRSMGMLSGEFAAFGRAEFEALIQDGLQDFSRLVTGCLEKAAQADSLFAETGPDLVILTGGHSAWYFAREILDGTMAAFLSHPLLDTVRREKQRVIGLPNPQSTVALGLVYSKLPLQTQEGGQETGRETIDQPENSGGQDQGTGSDRQGQPADSGRQEEPRTASQPPHEAARDNRPFCMTIHQHFKISGRGIAVIGQVSSGSIRPGDKVVVLEAGRALKTIGVLDVKPDGGPGPDGQLTLLLDTMRDIFNERQLLAAPEYLSGYSEPRWPEAGASGQRERWEDRRREPQTPPPPREDGMCYLSITRKGLSKATVKYIVEVDGTERYQLGFGATVAIPVKEGQHTLSFTFPNRNDRKAPMTFQVSGDMDLVLKVTDQGLKHIFTLTEGAKIIGSSVWQKC